MDQGIYRHLEWAHPLVREWFVDKFGTPTEPQVEGWPLILAGKTTLISAPTGSGKTLTAFLACINTLVCKATSGKLKNETEVVYVSPLKALSNDIQKNLDGPLQEIRELAEKKGIPMTEIRTAVRTGDTLAKERQAMLRKPPHILVTTPESLYILITADKSRKVLKTVETIILDEIHAVADDKRGAHLSISVERLENLALRKPQRIGLSATQNPIDLVAHFLAGNTQDLPVIVDVGHRRKLDMAVEVPLSPLGPIASHEQWDEVYERLTQLVNQHRSTLVFVNTRKLAERLAMNLGSRLGEDMVAAHHGSLSRKIRLNAERKLKNGEIKVLVATASLELGIDIGFVDLVCQISSPRSIAATLQRIGRAGHWRGAVPKGRVFAMTRDELVEAAALIRAIKSGDLDKLAIPECSMDILSQHIVAMCGAEEWSEDELFEIIKRAYPYRNLSREAFDQVISVLSEGISARRGRYGAYLLRDQVNSIVKGRRGARLAAITSGGAIPESNLYQVVAEPDGVVVGTLDEDFAIESNKGDIILLANTSWRIRRVLSREAKVSVEDAHGAPPTVPFWVGEGPARTRELSHHVAELRKLVSDMTPTVPADFMSRPKTEPVLQAVSWLKQECELDDAGAEQLVEYIVQGRAVLGTVPTEKVIIAERFFDESGGMQLVIHAPLGGRINKAWGLALRKKFCRSFNFELQAAATDNGLNIALAEQHSFPLGDVFYYLTVETLRHTLEQASLASPIFATRWRWDATRSLALLRFMGGKKVPPNLMRMRSDDLMAAVFPAAAACQDNQVGDIELPDHPLVNEVMKDVLTEALDLEGLEEMIAGIASGEITCLAVDTPVPSAFSHEILNANPYAYLDDAPLEERRARAVEMRRMLPDAVVREVGLLDEAAIAKVVEEVWPDVRDLDELHDFMLTAVVLPEELPGLTHRAPREIWTDYFEKLRAQRRAERARSGNITFWVAAERVKQFKQVYPDATFDSELPKIASSDVDQETAIVSIVQGWMSHVGPIAVIDLERLLGLPTRAIEIALLKLEAQGSVLRGKFSARFEGGVGAEVQNWEWCDRRLLARIHQLTVATLRKQVEPVTAALFMRWLSHWQHVAPGSQLTGERGTLEVLRQLQGFEIPANAWESQILAKRISNYDPQVLDRLCLNGAVGWGRLSPHPALLENGPASEPNEETASTNVSGIRERSSIKRVTPTSVAPITFFVREDADWMTSRHPELDAEDHTGLSHGAKEVKKYLRQRGASFFADIVRGCSLLKSEVETALWELVAAGLVTADGFDNLRALIDPSRRAGRGGSRRMRPRDSTGRWSLLYTDDIGDRTKIVEATCRVLLHRYGVLFRDLLARESVVPKWRELLYALRLMEDRGEIRGGRFVSGSFMGEQFALPEALESLRAFRNRVPLNSDLVLSAADPLNLIGIIVPGERVASISGKVIALPA
jgi:ATP-dependent helicase Lhr and Lhr-like helicase